MIGEAGKGLNALKQLGLAEVAHRKMAAYSRMWRVRLAQAIAHEPELLLLDEPLNGLIRWCARNYAVPPSCLASRDPFPAMFFREVDVTRSGHPHSQRHDYRRGQDSRCGRRSEHPVTLLLPGCISDCRIIV
jgi:hypothetical protein